MGHCRGSMPCIAFTEACGTSSHIQYSFNMYNSRWFMHYKAFIHYLSEESNLIKWWGKLNGGKAQAKGGLADCGNQTNNHEISLI